MGIQAIIMALRDSIDKTILDMNISIDNDTEKQLYINEIIAYIFRIEYGQNPTECINHYVNNYLGMQTRRDAELADEDLQKYYGDTYRANRVFLQSKKHLKSHSIRIDSFVKNGIITPKDYSQKYCIRNIESKGKNSKIRLDQANMIFLNQIATCNRHITDDKIVKKSYTLLDVLQKDYRSVDAVPVPVLAEAYTEIEQIYQTAKKTDNRIEYIAHWVNLYRLESSLHPSLIDQMADYMLDNKIKQPPNQTDLANQIWNPIIINFSFSNIICDSYAVLRDKDWIPYFFDDKTNAALAESILHSRITERNIINRTKKDFLRIMRQALPKTEKFDSNLFFQSFFNNATQVDIQDIYRFCHDSYPIIEWHKPINIFKKDEPNKISYSKIKYIRAITNILTPYEELKINI